MSHNLKKRIEIASGRQPADIVIKNCNVVNVYSGAIIKQDIALSDDCIAGLGSYHGHTEIDAEGLFALPGLIDSHIHVESSMVTPEEISRLLVPCGTSTIIADPHEIVNVCGSKGMEYMLEAAKDIALDIRYMLPSCVPATPFEHAGAAWGVQETKEWLQRKEVLGFGEYMNFVGVAGGKEADVEKLAGAAEAGKPIDGHCPNLTGKELNAYVTAGIHTDHECSTVEEMQDRLERGMYILMRQGSACHNLRTLIKGVTQQNSRRCLLCSDDRQPRTIFEEGHVNSLLRICVEEGLDPVTAIRMGTLNAAECYGLNDRGAIAPGLRGDIVLVKDLKEFEVKQVWLKGQLTAQNGQYLPKVQRKSAEAVQDSMHVSNFSEERLKLHLKTPRVHVIDIIPGGVVTGHGKAEVALTADGDFCYNPKEDIVKIAVVERHHATGNLAVGLLRGYGIKRGAIALSIAHDSHNVIAVGVSNEEIAFAVQSLLAQNGGIVLVKDRKVLAEMPLPIGGIMSDQSGEWVNERLTQIHETAFEELGVSHQVEPVMTLCFMALPVIPEVKITDMGLFDVTRFEFIEVEDR